MIEVSRYHQVSGISYEPRRSEIIIKPIDVNSKAISRIEVGTRRSIVEYAFYAFVMDIALFEGFCSD